VTKKNDSEKGVSRPVTKRSVDKSAKKKKNLAQKGGNKALASGNNGGNKALASGGNGGNNARASCDSRVSKRTTRIHQSAARSKKKKQQEVSQLLIYFTQYQVNKTFLGIRSYHESRDISCVSFGTTTFSS
jgi:hypothetical protein